MASANALEATAGTGPFRARRVAAGLSQQRLAELAGCSVAMVRVLEGGYKPSYSDVLGRIARVLDALQDDEDLAPHEPGPVTASAEQGRHGRE
ncbi:MAG: helix-turn-helix transcriptional regulator [Thermoleophilaceae bacterium]